MPHYNSWFCRIIILLSWCFSSLCFAGPPKSLDPNSIKITVDLEVHLQDECPGASLVIDDQATPDEPIRPTPQLTPKQKIKEIILNLQPHNLDSQQVIPFALKPWSTIFTEKNLLATSRALILTLERTPFIYLTSIYPAPPPPKIVTVKPIAFTPTTEQISNTSVKILLQDMTRITWYAHYNCPSQPKMQTLCNFKLDQNGDILPMSSEQKICQSKLNELTVTVANPEENEKNTEEKSTNQPQERKADPSYRSIPVPMEKSSGSGDDNGSILLRQQ